MIDPYAFGLLSVIASAIIARLIYDRRGGAWHHRPADAVAQSRLRDELTVIIGGLEESISRLHEPIDDLKEDLGGLGQAVKQLSERISHLEREPGPCAGCPARRGG